MAPPASAFHWSHMLDGYRKALESKDGLKKRKDASKQNTLLYWDDKVFGELSKEIIDLVQDVQAQKQDGGGSKEGKQNAVSFNGEFLASIVEWKNRRGKFRPGSVGRVRDHNDLVKVNAIIRDAVRMVLDSGLLIGKPGSTCQSQSLPGSNAGKSSEILSSSSSPRSTIMNAYQTKDKARLAEIAKQSLEKVCELYGVGPATASIILSLAFPGIFMFMSDEALEFFAPSHKPTKWKYSMDEYTSMLDKAHAWCTKLKAENGGVDVFADVQQCEKAVFSCLHSQRWDPTFKTAEQSAVDKSLKDEKDIENVDAPATKKRRAK